MKKITATLLLLAVALAAGAVDFTFTVPSGQTLKFTTLSGSTVKVVKHATKPVGDLVIPATVTNEGTTYSVVEIDVDAFRECGELTSVVIPEGVKTIGRMAFYGDTAMMAISLPLSLNDIGISAFTRTGYWLDTTNYSANGLLYIGPYLINFHEELAVGDIVIDDGTRGIAAIALYRDTNMTSVTIPASVQFIGMWAFEGCRNIDTVFMLGSTPPAMGSLVFGTMQGITVKVPCGAGNAYRAADVWRDMTIVEACASGGGGGGNPGDDPGGGGGMIAVAEVQPLPAAVQAAEGGLTITSQQPLCCSVSDALGRVVATVQVNGTAQVALPASGFYVVSTPGFSPVKVMVR
ncbi:MAG: leucine-rich repeat domain-containing protein [Bacteroidales bacterium]|nr:leucine-rich repeat domain-containing protein [Bacteroidales bacterium]